MSDAQQPSNAVGQVSPDGQFQWNGTAWVPNPNLPKPKKKHTVRNVILIIIVLFVAGTAGCLALIGGAANEIDKSIKRDDAAARKDVKLVRCGGFDSTMEMIGNGTVKVTNSDDKPQDYYIEVTYYAADGSALGTGNGSLENAVPGKTSTVKITSLDSITRAQSQGMTCKITDVTGVDL